MELKVIEIFEYTCENGSHLRNEPLRRVEAKNGDRFARFEAELDEALGGGVGVVVVLLVRPLFPLQNVRMVTTSVTFCQNILG